MSLEHGSVLVTNDRVYIGDVNGNAMEVVTLAHELNIGTINGMSVEEILDMMVDKGIGTGSSSGTIFPNAPSPGSIIDIGDYEYRIVDVNNDAGIVYVALAYWHENCQFSNVDLHVLYAGSDLAAKCAEWYNNEVPQEMKDKGIFIDTYVEGVTHQCFIPSETQVGGQVNGNASSDSGCFGFYIIQGNRIFRNSSGEAKTWWTSSQYGSGNYILRMRTDGNLLGYDTMDFGDNPNTYQGFRPHLAISISAFATGTVSA